MRGLCNIPPFGWRATERGLVALMTQPKHRRVPTSGGTAPRMRTGGYDARFSRGFGARGVLMSVHITGKADKRNYHNKSSQEGSRFGEFWALEL